MAITLDAVTNVTDYALPVTTMTFSHTVSGTLPVLLVTPIGANVADDDSSVTYNGVALQVALAATWNTNRVSRIYYMFNPPTGTHDVVVVYGSGGTAGCVAQSYNGVRSFGASGYTAFGVTASDSQTITTLSPNSLVFCFIVTNPYIGVITPSVGTNTVGNAHITPTRGVFTGDSGVVASPSSTTVGASFALAPDFSVIGALELRETEDTSMSSLWLM